MLATARQEANAPIHARDAHGYLVVSGRKTWLGLRIL
jgi:hypothetical protein